MKRVIPLAAVMVAGVALLAFALAGSKPEAARAAGPCGTTHDAVTSEELQLLGLLQAWRDANIAGSVPMQQSGALNAAAAWYAQHQVQAGPFGGHQDQYGRTWVQRAADCGYGGYAAGSGEGVSVIAGSGSIHIGPAEAMQGLNYPGSGINMPQVSSSLPSKCVGVGVYREGGATAWIVIIAQFPAAQACPASTATSPSATATTPATGTTTTATHTPTRTATATPTRTPTPTPTPTPTLIRRYIPQVGCDSCVALVPATPSATQTATPTLTPTATATSTPTVGPPTPTPPAEGCSGDADIVSIAKSGNPESVTVAGTGLIAGWYIVSENGSQRFDFPTGFVLDGTVDVISGWDGDPGGLPPKTIFWTEANVWLNGGDDDAFLYDCQGILRSYWDDGV
ncbi:MAG: hypothetical protein IT303_09215 [Dehalococcoidia bacterium]|nr:hypothetical protein [Dehalococcoidia bacterium]